ncbi:MAG: helix-turn-helix domain-containing protein [Paludibacteraceae bacterium]|nr:helix-turn-helix domain-containing protein [Paludibacteraceae bacterium]
MEFITIPCHESLRPFIRNYWMLSSMCTGVGTQQIFSNGTASLHFYLSQDVRLDDGDRHYRAVLFHQNLQKIGVVTVEGEFDIFGAEFVPFCSRVFFPTEMPDIYASPEDLHDEEFATLNMDIYEAESTEERVALLDSFFLKRLAQFPEGDINMERLSDVFDNMVPTDGSAAHPPHSQNEFSPADLASAACLSQKQFTRIFNKYVGMNPKSYLRLLRFHKALMELHSSADNSSLTNIAWRCGYYDLAHMTSDFRDICGSSPSELIQHGQNLTEAFGQKFSGLMKKKIKIENMI